MDFPNISLGVGRILTARHASGSLILGGIDILLGTASEHIISYAYSDNTNDEADDLSIMIADPHRTWMQTYIPRKGVECTGEIKVSNWNIIGDSRKIDCGTFWVDQLDFAGPPNVVTVKAISIPIATGIKNEKRSKSWEGQDLKSIAQDIATRGGLTLVWATKKANPDLEPIEQTTTPDLEFLRDKLMDNSFKMKIYKKQLVVYSAEEYEARPPAYTLTYGQDHIQAFSFSSKLEEIYASAENAWTDPRTGKVKKHKFLPMEPPPTESVERTNEDTTESADDAPSDGGDDAPGEELFRRRIITLSDGREASADDFIDYTTGSPASDEETQKTKSKLRDKNKHEKEATILLLGNPDYLSGLNMQLSGFGIFDTKWFIDSTLHSISSTGYTTELKIHACLKDY